MRVAFEVGLELEIEVKEGDYHYDNSDTCYTWVRVCCEGDLACGLDDWEIASIAPYNPKNAPLIRFPMHLSLSFRLIAWRMKPLRSSKSFTRRH